LGGGLEMLPPTKLFVGANPPKINEPGNGDPGFPLKATPIDC